MPPSRRGTVDAASAGGEGLARDLIGEGIVRTTLRPVPGKVDAATLRRAHEPIGTNRARGKSVLVA
ncbi:hypothetical protein CY652_08740 [Burkholderia sp. WAC0059]|nr:hypothetical protein CY652_08740 [Burkholderia sp. WAC0059]